MMTNRSTGRAGACLTSLSWREAVLMLNFAKLTGSGAAFASFGRR